MVQTAHATGASSLAGSSLAASSLAASGIDSPVTIVRVRDGEPAPLKRRAARRAGSALSMRALMAPMLVFLALMVALPLLYAAWLSLTDFRFGQEPAFIGLANYRAMLGDEAFWNGLRVTFALYAISLVLQIVAGTYLGMLLNRLRFARRLLQTVLMTPFLLPPVVIGMMWLVILDPSLGAANWILQSLGLPPSDWLASPRWVVPVMALLDTWQWTPFVALLVLGGLQTMPDGVDEAAAIDGARGLSMLRYITLPLLMPTLLVAVILRSVDLLRFFDLIYITTQGGPGTASQSLNVYAFRRGLEFFDMGYASALMITLAAVVLGVVLALSRLRRAVAW